MKKIIIFRTDRLGDYIIHSRPIYEIKQKYDDSYIVVVCSKINKKILKEVNYIDELIEFNKTDTIFKKIKTFFYIIKAYYHAIFVLDGKNFSYLCNIFARAKRKYGLLYQSKKKFFFDFKSYKPSKLYAFLFFNKTELFTSRKYLVASENLCQKYLNLFNELNLDLTIQDKYIFQSPKKIKSEFNTLASKLDLKNYIIIHLDEKWQDIKDIKTGLSTSLTNFQKKINKKIIITAFNNDFDYFKNIKIDFPYYNCVNSDFKNVKISNITILDNINIFMFERFLKFSDLNISCHSGFVAQVSGANGSKLLDIINEADHEWYSCWKPMNTSHNFTFKSFKSGLNKKSNEIFNEIISFL